MHCLFIVYLRVAISLAPQSYGLSLLPPLLSRIFYRSRHKEIGPRLRISNLYGRVSVALLRARRTQSEKGRKTSARRPLPRPSGGLSPTQDHHHPQHSIKHRYRRRLISFPIFILLSKIIPFLSLVPAHSSFNPGQASGCPFFHSPVAVLAPVHSYF